MQWAQTFYFNSVKFNDFTHSVSLFEKKFTV